MVQRYSWCNHEQGQLQAVYIRESGAVGTIRDMKRTVATEPWRHMGLLRWRKPNINRRCIGLSSAPKKCYRMCYYNTVLRHGGFNYVEHEARFEAKAEQSRTGIGNRRNVFGDGGRSIRGNRHRVGGRCVAAEDRTGSPSLPRRGRNLRRQLVDILRLRQGTRRNKPSRRRETCLERLRRLSRLSRLQRLPMRLERLRRLRRLRSGVVCIPRRLPRLLGGCNFPTTLINASYIAGSCLTRRCSS